MEELRDLRLFIPRQRESQLPAVAVFECGLLGWILEEISSVVPQVSVGTGRNLVGRSAVGRQPLDDHLSPYIAKLRVELARLVIGDKFVEFQEQAGLDEVWSVAVVEPQNIEAPIPALRSCDVELLQI